MVGAVVAARSRVWPFGPSGEPGPAPAPAARLRVWTPRLAAVAAGALPALAFPATDIWVLAFVGLVPLVWLVVGARSGRDAVARVFLGGVGFFLAAYHWLVPTVGPFVVLLAALFGALWIPWGVLAFRLLRGRPGTLALATATLVVPSAWVLAEYLRSWEGLGGPWALLGAALWSRPTLGAVASLGGVWLTGFVLMAVNVAATAGARPGARGPTRVVALAVALGLAGGSWAYGAWRPEPPAIDGAPSMVVAGVQPGRVSRGDERFDAHLELSRELEGRDDLDLLVWAESSVGFDLAERPDASSELQELAGLLGAPVLVNVDARRGEGGIFKSSVLVGPEGVEARYDKRRLVPFGEYVPARSLLGWMSSITDAAEENRRRGDALVVMDVEVAGPSGDGVPVGLGPLVCFESAFPDLTRELARRGADLMVLQTATTTFQGSWAQDQHAALGAVRAVETGRPVVHAAVSGVSAVFDAEGNQLTRLDNDSTGVWLAEVPLVGGVTPYVRWGDWVPAACVVVLVAAALAAGLRAGRREGPGPAGAP